MNEPIFESVWDALRFSFYMEAMPAGVPSSTWTAIKSMMKNSGKVFDRVQSRIHMHGLTPLEVRGQCAMVRACVEDHLTAPEKYALLARHGLDITRLKGVKGLIKHIEHLTVNQGECLEWIVLLVYSDSISIRWIAKKYEVSKSSVSEDGWRVKAATDAIERIACERLDGLFKQTNLIGCELSV